MKLLVLISIFISFQTLASESLLEPFSTDGCSVVPDFSYTKCCVEHDYYYWKGGTEEERKKADQKLAACINQNHDSDLIGRLFYFGVRLGGHPQFTNSFRWGYGWPQTRGYRSLSEAELAQVAKLEPIDIYQVPITEPNSNLIKLPSKFDNYCFDEIHQYISKNHSETMKIEVIRTIKLNRYVSVRVYLENQSVILFRYRRNRWDKCRLPVFQEKLPHYYFSVQEY